MTQKQDDAAAVAGHSPWREVVLKAPLTQRQELATRFVEAMLQNEPDQYDDIIQFAFHLADKILEDEDDA